MDREASGAFVVDLDLPPYGTGPLDGLSFAVKDLIDVSGVPTGCGSPGWLRTRGPAPANAVCVDQLLGAGARCSGKTLTDELAFGLLGENHFYGTPLNPAAPDRVPGGSSSGSASAVACGLVDFALGTDTGGSIRVPASNCGLFGLRPSHGLVSVAGVFALAPSFDTVGLLAGDIDVLCRAAGALLSCRVPDTGEVGTVHVLAEAFALADPAVAAALAGPVGLLRELFGERVRDTSVREIDQDPEGQELRTWNGTNGVIQWAEMWSTLGAWIAATRPELGPVTEATVEGMRKLDRGKVGPAVRRREELARRLAAFLGPHDLLCIPTVHAPAPPRGSLTQRGQTREYYGRALSLTALAGIGRLPEVSLPLGTVDGLPVGLSLLAARWEDAFLLQVARVVTERAFTALPETPAARLRRAVELAPPEFPPH